MGIKSLTQTLAPTLRQVDPAVILLLGLPWLLAFNNDFWLFDVHLGIDPWVYLGFIVRLPQYLPVYFHTYYSTRLPWILPGHLFFQIAPPLVAQYLLHITFYYLAIFAIYGLLKRLCDRRIALLTTVMMGCYTWFLNAIGSNYVDGAGIAYYSVTAYLTVRTTQAKHWQRLAVLSGMFCGLTIFSNLTWVSLTPPLLGLYLYYNRGDRAHPLGRSLALAIAGLLTTIVSLGAINYAFNQRFFFFQSSLNAVSSLLFVMHSPWHGNLLEVLPNASWLIFLGVTGVASLTLLLISRWQRIVPLERQALGLHGFFLLSFGLYFLMELGRISTFQYYYYTSYLIPATFLAVGAQFRQLQSPLQRLSPPIFATTIAGIIGITLIAYRLPLQPELLRHQAVWLLVGLSSIWVGLALGSWYWRDRGATITRSAIVWLLTSFLVANVVSIVALSPVALWSQPLGTAAPRLLYPSQHQRHDAFLATVAAQRWLQAIDPQVTTIFWYNYDESLIYRSIASMGLAVRVGEERFPATGAERGTPEQVQAIQAQLAQMPQIVILSQQPDALQQAQSALRPLGLQAEVVTIHPIQQGSVAFTMTLIQVRTIAP